jgi:anti-anti-sigma regulatory factor
MDRAAEHLQLLIAESARLFEADPRPSHTEIDLAGVTEIDASGCQLLAVFQENLKKQGLVPETSGIAPELMETMLLLGFADQFAASAAPLQAYL